MKTENMIGALAGVVTIALGLYTFQRMRAAVPGAAASSPSQPRSAPGYVFTPEQLAYQRDMADVWL